MSKQISTDDVREKFLAHVAMLVAFWEKESRVNTLRDKLEGLAFSIMSTLDGCSMNMPGFQVVASPHVDDKAYHRERGEDYYAYAAPHPEDIAGTLHERIYTYLEKTR